MKALGILCVFLTCAGTGFYLAMMLRKEVRIYERLTAFLKDCSVYIQYQNLPLQELFQILAGNPDYAGLQFLQNIREFRQDFETVWSCAVQSGTLPEDAERILLNLGHELGKTDVSGQIALLELYQNQMTRAYEDARTACFRKTKLYQSLGCLGGAMLAILFL